MSEPITNAADAVRALGALPVPVGPEPQALSDERLAVLRKLRTHCEADRFESEDERPLHVWGPSPYPGSEMCQRCTARRVWAEDADADEVVLVAEVDRLLARVAELESERHSTNEALDDAVQELRAKQDRIAALERQAEFAASVRELAEEILVQWAAGRLTAEQAVAGVRSAFASSGSSVTVSADKLTRLFAPSQALREDPHDSPLHRGWRLGRDLPGTGGAGC